MGTQQSGALDLMIADLGKDQIILQQARQAAIRILEDDAELNKPANGVIRQQIDSMKKTVVNWSKIS
jgi:ATP-dependent DNA helicase RecG